MNKDGICRIKDKYLKFEIILAIVAFASAIISFHTLYYNMYVLGHGIPHEYREGVAIKLAVEFAKGNNPYSIAYNESNVPIINHYGWFTAYFLSLFIRMGKVFSVARPEIICTIVTIGIVAVGYVSFFGGVWTQTNNCFLAAFSAGVAISCYWRCGFIGGTFSDSYGLTMSFILFWIVEVDNKRKHYRVPLYILLVILLFYTKQYYLLCGVGVLVWLWFSDRKACMKYAVYGIICGVISIIVVNLLLPLYLTEALLFGVGCNITAPINIEYAKMQFLTMFRSYEPMFIIIICYCIAIILHAITNKQKMNLIGLFTKYEMIMLVIGTAACMKLGQSVGAVYSYFLQLWIPYVIIVASLCASRVIDSKESIRYAYVFTIIILLLTSRTYSRFITENNISGERSQNWDNVYEILDEYNNRGEKILIGNVLSFYAIDHNVEAFDYGNSEYVYSGMLDNTNPFFLKLFKHAELLVERVEETRMVAKKGIENGDYCCVVITDNGNPCGISQDDIEKTGKYSLNLEVDLQTGIQTWHTYIYILDSI